MELLQLKANVQAEGQRLLEKKIQNLEAMLSDLNDALRSESKSTAGDKHETGRAMAHLEIEKLGRQLADAKKMAVAFNGLDADKTLDTVGPGALVKTSMGLFYVSVALGKIEANGKSIFALSPGAPLGRKILGAKKGDEIPFNGKRIAIVEVV